MSITEPQPILWRRLDLPGHESARLTRREPGYLLAGSAVFAHNRRPCRLDYQVTCDAMWQTLSGKVEGWVGDQAIKVEISVDQQRRWWLNGINYPDVSGCYDLDLNFSPSTNLLPIRRLRLALGEEGGVRAAWLRFPSFTLEPLEQFYTHIDEGIYRYMSVVAGSFIRDLKVNNDGFVTMYPSFWEQECI